MRLDSTLAIVTLSFTIGARRCIARGVGMMFRAFSAAALLVASIGSTPVSAATFFVFGDSPSGAQTLTVNGTTTWTAKQTGWFDSTGHHSAAQANYFTGSLIDWMGTMEYRSFFSFQPLGPVTSASITIGNALGNGYANYTGGALELTLYDVSSSIVGLLGYNGATSIFNDLGSGTVFGKVRIDAAAASYTIALNQAGVDAVNAAYYNASYFTLGGRLTTVPSSVPEPAAWALLIGGVGVAGGALRTRRRTAMTAA